MPLVFAGTALSAMMIEPIYDNTLLYWYPDENDLALFRAYERTIPWYVPLGCAITVAAAWLASRWPRQPAG